MPTEADKLFAIHIADNDGVTLFKTCTAEVFVRPRTLETEVSKYSRPARTPPSTFLFLHLHLSNSPGSENPTPQAGRVIKTLIRRQMTTDWDRLFFTHHHEELDGHDKLPWPRGQCSAALSGRFIGPPNRRCQRLSSTKLHIESENPGQPGSPYISGVCAVLEPQSCDVLRIS